MKNRYFTVDIYHGCYFFVVVLN